MATGHGELLATTGPCALLESTCGPGPRSGLSLLARHPLAVALSGRDGTRIHRSAGAVSVYAGDPLDAVRSLLREIPAGRWPEEGGVVGALSYDHARPGRPPAPTPLMAALAVDRFEVFEAEGGPAEPRAVRGPARLDIRRHSNLTRAEYVARVLRVKEHIAAGDIYQANFSQRFVVPAAAGGLALYGQLRRISPAPFAGYLRAGGLELVSSSPERLLLVDGGRAEARPMAGTRPRSPDPEADRALARDLMLSEKERAEHLMLVDLARNDLGRVAEVGSVSVDELMTAEEYSHVRHIVSNVTCRLAAGRDALDALRALFPGGTITGVPKIRCMEILDALEPAPRGLYTGALFYVTPSGRLDANILIRSAVVQDGAVTFHAGGGIVADSDPGHEYEETLHKAEAMRLALEAVLD